MSPGKLLLLDTGDTGHIFLVCGKHLILEFIILGYHECWESIIEEKQIFYFSCSLLPLLIKVAKKFDPLAWWPVYDSQDHTLLKSVFQAVLIREFLGVI